MHSTKDLLALRQHLRNAVASLRTMVLEASAEQPESGECLLKSLDESARVAVRIDRQDKDPDLEAVWDQFKARLDRFREAADTSHDLLERWKADERPESFQAAAAFMSKHLFCAHATAMSLLNHLISVVAFDWPAAMPSAKALACDTSQRGLGLCRELERVRERAC